MSLAKPPPRRWSVEEYHRAAEFGIFGPEERLELVDGEILCMSPRNSRHATGSSLAESALRAIFQSGYCVRVQKPLTLGPTSEPEPDIAVVRGTARDYARGHPTTAVLVVEVADTSLAYDRTQKAALYARAGIPEYWVLNLPDRLLEVHREPDPAAERYQSIIPYGDGDTVSPLAAPGAQIVVADLLP